VDARLEFDFSQAALIAASPMADAPPVGRQPSLPSGSFVHGRWGIVAVMDQVRRQARRLFLQFGQNTWSGAVAAVEDGGRRAGTGVMTANEAAGCRDSKERTAVPFADQARGA
jgi:hypothetical protein